MTTRVFFICFVPMACLTVVALIVNKLQSSKSRGKGGWWRSPARRAEVAENHPYLGSWLIVAVTSSPWPAAGLLLGTSFAWAALLWMSLTAGGTFLMWAYIWRVRRRDPR